MDEVDRVLGEVVWALLPAVHDVLVGLGTRGSLEGGLAAQALKRQDADGPHIHRVRVGQQRLVLVLLRPALLRAHQHLRTQLALTLPVGLHCWAGMDTAALAGPPSTGAALPGAQQLLSCWAERAGCSWHLYMLILLS